MPDPALFVATNNRVVDREFVSPGRVGYFKEKKKTAIDNNLVASPKV